MSAAFECTGLTAYNCMKVKRTLAAFEAKSRVRQRPSPTEETGALSSILGVVVHISNQGMSCFR